MRCRHATGSIDPSAPIRGSDPPPGPFFCRESTGILTSPMGLPNEMRMDGVKASMVVWAQFLVGGGSDENHARFWA